jgi:peptidoglycan/xylan/chitin deacetylase (PgdA/CDA1 family)
MNRNPVSVLRNASKRWKRAHLRRRTPHNLVLMYHRVAPTPFDHLGMVISPEHFGQQLDVLSRVTDIVPLAELEDHRRPGRNQLPRAAITFDDGYADNLLYAEPLLARFAAPCTVFIATSLVGQPDPFWWDVLAAIVFGNHPLPRELRILIGPDELHVHVRSADRRPLFHHLRSRLKVVGHNERLAALAKLRDWAGVPPALDPIARPMTRDELCRLHSSKFVEIGAHTRNHPSLPSLPAKDQLDEIAGSKKDCEQMLDFSPSSFAYPYGDFGAETPGIVANAGFVRAYSTRQELNFLGTDPLLIPRFGVADWPGKSFERQLRREWFP